MTSPLVYDGISRQWRDRIDQTHDYAVIRNDTRFRAGFTDSFVFESEYNRMEQLKQQLIDEYDGISVEDAFHGIECDTDEGPCYCVRSAETLSIPDLSGDAIIGDLHADLTLVRGIGIRTGALLRARGYHRIEHLVHHRRYARAAGECLDVLRSRDPHRILSLVRRWHPASHAHILRTAGLYEKERFIFLDLETLGLFSRPVILFGLARFSHGRLECGQYLLRTMAEELAALRATRAFLGDDGVLVSFNGRAFDLPCLRERYAFYGESPLIPNPHYDLLPPSRRRYRRVFPDCRLTTLERRLFGIWRDHDIPSSMVPEFYQAYLTTGNPGPLVPVLDHNRQDLVTLARLFCLYMEDPDGHRSDR
ncbi:MAG: ribonuclease H-like domain-containing protein [Methanoregulaceae archaeon]|nr:ribonuclease H-like domain-containing protein [Methanoregulaceae archaeon]